MATQKRFIIVDCRSDRKIHTSTYTPISYVVAPPGYYRAQNGEMIHESGRYSAPSPEWGSKRKHAHIFDSHRAAARVCNLCSTARIESVKT